MEKNALLKARLETKQEEVAAAQRIATAMAERISASLVYDRASNISDFRGLHPTSIFEIGTLLWLEEWLINMENLLEVAHIPSRVKSILQRSNSQTLLELDGSLRRPSQKVDSRKDFLGWVFYKCHILHIYNPYFIYFCNKQCYSGMFSAFFR